MNPVVAERMNALPKVVFSRHLESVSWNNARLLRGDLVEEVVRLKAETGPDMVILGSGSIVAQLTEARLIDGWQLVVNAIVLGSGRTPFEGVKAPVGLKLERSKTFGNGNVVLWYVVRARGALSRSLGTALASAGPARCLAPDEGVLPGRAASSGVHPAMVRPLRAR